MRACIAGLTLLALSGCSDAPGSDTAAAELRDAPPEAASISATAKTSVTGCEKGEEAIFSCKAANGKRLAVCAAPQGQSVYRYGGASPEIELQGGKLAIVAYSGGGEAQISFAGGTTSYVVFSRMVRTNFASGEPNDPAISDGVVVLEGNSFAGIQLCDDPDVLPVQYDAAERVMARQDDVFTTETERGDPNWTR